MSVDSSRYPESIKAKGGGEYARVSKDNAVIYTLHGHETDPAHCWTAKWDPRKERLYFVNRADKSRREWKLPAVEGASSPDKKEKKDKKDKADKKDKSDKKEKKDKSDKKEKKEKKSAAAAADEDDDGEGAAAAAMEPAADPLAAFTVPRPAQQHQPDDGDARSDRSVEAADGDEGQGDRGRDGQPAADHDVPVATAPQAPSADDRDATATTAAAAQVDDDAVSVASAPAEPFEPNDDQVLVAPSADAAPATQQHDGAGDQQHASHSAPVESAAAPSADDDDAEAAAAARRRDDERELLAELEDGVAAIAAERGKPEPPSGDHHVDEPQPAVRDVAEPREPTPEEAAATSAVPQPTGDLQPLSWRPFEHTVNASFWEVLSTRVAAADAPDGRRFSGEDVSGALSSGSGDNVSVIISSSSSTSNSVLAMPHDWQNVASMDELKSGSKQDVLKAPLRSVIAGILSGDLDGVRVMSGALRTAVDVDRGTAVAFAAYPFVSMPYRATYSSRPWPSLLTAADTDAVSAEGLAIGLAAFVPQLVHTASVGSPAAALGVLGPLNRADVEAAVAAGRVVAIAMIDAPGQLSTAWRTVTAVVQAWAPEIDSFAAVSLDASRTVSMVQQVVVDRPELGDGVLGLLQSDLVKLEGWTRRHAEADVSTYVHAAAPAASLGADDDEEEDDQRIELAWLPFAQILRDSFWQALDQRARLAGRHETQCRVAGTLSLRAAIEDGTGPFSLQLDGEGFAGDDRPAGSVSRKFLSIRHDVANCASHAELKQAPRSETLRAAMADVLQAVAAGTLEGVSVVRGVVRTAIDYTSRKAVAYSAYPFLEMPAEAEYKLRPWRPAFRDAFEALVARVRAFEPFLMDPAAPETPRALTAKDVSGMLAAGHVPIVGMLDHATDYDGIALSHAWRTVLAVVQAWAGPALRRLRIVSLRENAIATKVAEVIVPRPELAEGLLGRITGGEPRVKGWLPKHTSADLTKLIKPLRAEKPASQQPGAQSLAASGGRQRSTSFGGSTPPPSGGAARDDTLQQQPASSSTVLTPDDTRSRAEAILRERAPEDLHLLDGYLAEYDGHPRLLLQFLDVKYRPETAALERQSSSFAAAPSPSPPRNESSAAREKERRDHVAAEPVEEAVQQPAPSAPAPTAPAAAAAAAAVTPEEAPVPSQPAATTAPAVREPPAAAAVAETPQRPRVTAAGDVVSPPQDDAGTPSFAEHHFDVDDLSPQELSDVRQRAHSAVADAAAQSEAPEATRQELEVAILPRMEQVMAAHHLATQRLDSLRRNRGASPGARDEHDPGARHAQRDGARVAAHRDLAGEVQEYHGMFDDELARQGVDPSDRPSYLSDLRQRDADRLYAAAVDTMLLDSAEFCVATARAYQDFIRTAPTPSPSPARIRDDHQQQHDRSVAQQPAMEAGSASPAVSPSGAQTGGQQQSAASPDHHQDAGATAEVSAAAADPEARYRAALEAIRALRESSPSQQQQQQAASSSGNAPSPQVVTELMEEAERLASQSPARIRQQDEVKAREQQFEELQRKDAELVAERERLERELAEARSAAQKAAEAEAAAAAAVSKAESDAAEARQQQQQQQQAMPPPRPAGVDEAVMTEPTVQPAAAVMSPSAADGDGDAAPAGRQNTGAYDDSRSPSQQQQPSRPPAPWRRIQTPSLPTAAAQENTSAARAPDGTPLRYGQSRHDESSAAYLRRRSSRDLSVSPIPHAEAAGDASAMPQGLGASPSNAAAAAPKEAFLQWDRKRSGAVLLTQDATAGRMDPGGDARVFYCLGTLGVCRGEFAFEVMVEIPSEVYTSANYFSVGVASKRYRGAAGPACAAYVLRCDGAILAQSDTTVGTKFLDQRLPRTCRVTVHVDLHNWQMAYYVDSRPCGVAFRFTPIQDPEPLFPVVVFGRSGGTAALVPPSAPLPQGVSPERVRQMRQP